MTCIVGLVSKGRVYIGGDSAGSGGWDLSIRRDRKVFRNGPFIFGFTSSYRMGQLLHYAFTPPNHPDGMDTEHYMTTVFIDAIRECLKAGGYAKKTSEHEEGGTFLVGYRGRLFCIQDDYQVGENEDGYDACGGGQNIALGALYATAHLKEDDPEWRILNALAAAEQWTNGVRRPFHIEILEP